MKMSAKVEGALILLLFLFSIYMWSLPIKNYSLPYGEPDGAHHFGIADYITKTDKINERMYEPLFLYYSYSHRSYVCSENETVCTKSPYTHNFFINQAIAQVLGGDRFVSYYLFLAISCLSIVISSYFLIRKLFGIIPAFLAALLISASKIDILTFIMGQYVILVSFAMLPITLYCYYQYIDSYLNSQPRQIYAYIMALLIGIQYLINIQSLIDTFMIILIFTILIIIKERKIPFKFKHVFISAIIIIILIGLFISNSIMSLKSEVNAAGTGVDVSHDWKDFFKWYTSGYSKITVGQSIFSYKEMHSYWTLPLLVIGVLFLLLRRQKKDLLMLSWFIALYLILHFDLLLGWGTSRLFRSVNEVPYMFYAIMGIGFMALTSFINFNPKLKKYLLYSLIVVFILLFFNFNLKSSYQMLDGAYPFPLRINPYQLEASIWMDNNLPENSFIYNYGTLMQSTDRFIKMVSHRYICEGQNDEIDWQRSNHPNETIEITHYFIDYSELAMLGMNKEIQELQNWEKSNLGNITPIYNKDYIRIYNARRN